MNVCSLNRLRSHQFASKVAPTSVLKNNKILIIVHRLFFTTGWRRIWILSFRFLATASHSKPVKRDRNAKSLVYVLTSGSF